MSSNPAEDGILNCWNCWSQQSSHPPELTGKHCSSAQSRHMFHMSFETLKPGLPPCVEILASSLEDPSWQPACRHCRSDARPWDGLAAFHLSKSDWRLSCLSVSSLPQHREREEGTTRCCIYVVVSLLIQAVEEILNNQPFLHAVVWACLCVLL